MLLIMIPDQYPNYCKALEIYTGYFDSLDNMILFSYPSSIVITRDYCSSNLFTLVSVMTFRESSVMMALLGTVYSSVLVASGYVDVDSLQKQ